MKKILFLICIVLFSTLQSIAQDGSSQDSIRKPQNSSTEIEEYSNEVQNFKEQFESLKKWGVLSICVVLGVIFIVLVIVCKKSKGRDEIVEIVLDSRLIREAFAPPKKQQPQNTVRNIQLSEKEISEKEINVIVDRVLECLKLNEKDAEPSPPQSIEVSNPIISPARVYKYLKGKTGKAFSRVENTPEDSFFRLYNEDGDTADFEFFGDDNEAIAKRVFHDDICNILSGHYQNACSVQIVKPGKVKRTGEQWSVIEPIKIKLI